MDYYFNPYAWTSYRGPLCEASDGGYYQANMFGPWGYGRFATPETCIDPKCLPCQDDNKVESQSLNSGFGDNYFDGCWF